MHIHGLSSSDILTLVRQLSKDKHKGTLQHKVSGAFNEKTLQLKSKHEYQNLRECLIKTFYNLKSFIHFRML